MTEAYCLLGADSLRAAERLVEAVEGSVRFPSKIHGPVTNVSLLFPAQGERDRGHFQASRAISSSTRSGATISRSSGSCMGHATSRGSSRMKSEPPLRPKCHAERVQQVEQRAPGDRVAEPRLEVPGGARCDLGGRAWRVRDVDWEGHDVAGRAHDVQPADLTIDAPRAVAERTFVCRGP